MRTPFYIVFFLSLLIAPLENASSKTYRDPESNIIKKDLKDKAEPLKYYFSLGASYPIYSESSALRNNALSKKFMGHSAVGALIKDKTALELEITYYRNKHKRSIFSDININYNMRYTAALINGYYYFPTKYNTKAFFGAGAGTSYAINSTKTHTPLSPTIIENNKYKNYDFAYQLLIGAHTKISNGFYIDYKLRWLSLGRFRTLISNSRFNNIALSAGIKYLF